jgi:hypothetical protein
VGESNVALNPRRHHQKHIVVGRGRTSGSGRPREVASSLLSPRLGAVIPTAIKLVVAAIIPAIIKLVVATAIRSSSTSCTHRLGDAEVLKQTETSRLAATAVEAVHRCSRDGSHGCGLLLQ